MRLTPVGEDTMGKVSNDSWVGSIFLAAEVAIAVVGEKVTLRLGISTLHIAVADEGPRRCL